MKNLNIKKFTINILIVFLIFFFDRVSKAYVINYFDSFSETQIMFNSFINIILVWNSGIGFGLLSYQESGIYNLITTIIIFINLVIIYYICKYEDIRSIFLSLILGGSLGNLFDRLYFSAVPDFIDLNYNDFHWFIFNVADIFITLGVLCLIFVELIFNNLKKNNNE